MDEKIIALAKKAVIETFKFNLDCEPIHMSTDALEAFAKAIIADHEADNEVDIEPIARITSTIFGEDGKARHSVKFYGDVCLHTNLFTQNQVAKYIDEKLESLNAIIDGYNLGAHQKTECIRAAKIAHLEEQLAGVRRERDEILADVKLAMQANPKRIHMLDMQNMLNLMAKMEKS